MEDQTAILFLAINGYLVDVKVENISSFIKTCLTYLKNQRGPLMRGIAETGNLSAEQEEELRNAVEAFKGLRQ